MLKAGITQAMIKEEPMLFSSTVKFALANAGPITRSFLHNVPDEFFNDPTAIIDTRVHMLMPGWFPCIPGWHHDDVPRNTADGQPNYVDPPYQTRHVMGLVGADVAPTEFAYGPVVVEHPQPPTMVYKGWVQQIENVRTVRAAYPDPAAFPDIAPLTFEVHQAADRVLYEFDCNTFHRGVAAVKNGWRWFGRISIGRASKVAPEIRRQVQVYMPTINAGW